MIWDRRIFIAQLNVEHYQRLLKRELSEYQRNQLNALLKEEETKLTQLKSSIAEEHLLGILEALAGTAGKLLEGTGQEPFGLTKDQLTLIFDRVPCAVGLIDTAGDLRISNALMSRFLPERIPSRDPEQLHRWHFPTDGGGRLNPFLWPSARALRGDAVTPGIEGFYTTDAGEHIATRVASFPVWQEGKALVLGAISAVYDFDALGRNGNGRTLERVFQEVAQSTKNGRQGRG